VFCGREKLVSKAMNGHFCDSDASLSGRIAALVRERGWCQKEFARRAGLSVQTVREILERSCPRRLRNRTIFGCAQALGISVAELRGDNGAHSKDAANGNGRSLLEEDLRYDLATQPQVKEWLQNQRTEATQYSREEIGELLSIQGTGGPLTVDGLAAARRLVERKRELIQRVHVIAGTEYLGLLESVVSWLFQRIQPYASEA
jgi:lambda repressor-like predicted transcriptional regulator